MILNGAFDCGSRVPPQLRLSTPGAEPPAKREVGAWIKFADDQTGQLDKANDSKETSLWIIDNCEAEKNKAAQAAKPKKLLDRLAFWN